MLCGCCRMSLHLQHHSNHSAFSLGLAFISTKTHLLHFKLNDFSSSNLDFRGPLVAGCIQPKSPFINTSLLNHSLSEQEDDGEPPSERLSAVQFHIRTGGIVALGKFEALHIGHRELAIQAARVGIPFLLSFVGMAEVLGWEPRAPIVANCDRKRILSSWAPYCGDVTPTEFELDFSKVRSLTPRQFVEKLSKELGVCGVVAGKNYRFGYRASGDASDLVKLCEEYNMEAYIINSVMDKKQDSRAIGFDNPKEQGQVSSTRVRHALGRGEIKYVSELLGRQHRLMLMCNAGESSMAKGWEELKKTDLRSAATQHRGSGGHTLCLYNYVAGETFTQSDNGPGLSLEHKKEVGLASLTLSTKIDFAAAWSK
ncbi:hypothetical protein AgCh_032751 [Apium graveolens]